MLDDHGPSLRPDRVNSLCAPQLDASDQQPARLDDVAGRLVHLGEVGEGEAQQVVAIAGGGGQSLGVFELFTSQWPIFSPSGCGPHRPGGGDHVALGAHLTLPMERLTPGCERRFEAIELIERRGQAGVQASE